jgi:hypothetical protein
VTGEPPVEYATAPHRGEAAASLARAWDLTEARAAALLADTDEYRAEHRARNRLTGREALSRLERAYARPWLP